LSVKVLPDGGVETPDQRGARTITGEPSNSPPERSNPSRS
jgi:hypothetical protein